MVTGTSRSSWRSSREPPGRRGSGALGGTGCRYSSQRSTGRLALAAAIERIAQEIGMLSSTPPSITWAARSDRGGWATDSLKMPCMFLGKGSLPRGALAWSSSGAAQTVAGSNAPG